MDIICTALNLSDKKKCEVKATAANGLFCKFHARQCHAMYAGYKRRGARLDEVEALKPKYLATSKTDLSNETFNSVEDEKILNNLFVFLFRKRNLLERVIKARKLHHSHFYSLELDYGHQAYIDRLIDEKAKVTRALERLQRRTTEVLFEKQQWFQWVRQCQDDEDAAREKESKKVKKEAQLFKRHWKEVEARLRVKRKQEDEKRQDAYLEGAFKERQAQVADMKMEAEDDAEEWDPIEDAIEDERNNYVDLMKRLLWLAEEPELSHEDESSNGKEPQNQNSEKTTKTTVADGEDVECANVAETPQEKKARKKARAKARAQAISDEKKERESNSSGEARSFEVNESQNDMRQRLIHGEEFGYAYRKKGWYRTGTFENPPELDGKVPGMSNVEAEELLRQVAQVKELLFCRLLLSHASVLSAAIRADSIQDFLADPEINTADLRDICFRLEQPTLQEIRDACADLAQHRNPDEVAKIRDDQTDLEFLRYRALVSRIIPPAGKIPYGWRSQHERKVDEQSASRRQIKINNDAAQTIVDFGKIDKRGQFQNTKVKVRVCGRIIWNYPSEGTMARGGWLTFSILTKGSRLEDAVSLCRNWQEFWELGCLAMYRYFPSGKWSSWAGDQFQSQMLQLGLIPYLLRDGAEKATVKHQIGSSRGQIRRAHEHVEVKNVMSACINRNDPVSRRFVKYLAMEAGTICLLVRDAKTGRVLLKPPEEHLWLIRDKGGIGRAVKNNAWTIRAEVNETMLETLETSNVRRWRFGFNEYYDITMWDLQPGEHISKLYNTVQDALIKAHRIRSLKGLHNLVEPVLKTLHRDSETGKVRDARGTEQTMFDELHSDKYRVVFGSGDEDGVEEWERRCYNDADAAEDSILFPDEHTANPLTAILDLDDPIYGKLTDVGPNYQRFAIDADTSDESEGHLDSHERIEMGNDHAEDDCSDEEDQLLNHEIDTLENRLHYREDDTSDFDLEDIEYALEDKALARRVWNFIETVPENLDGTNRDTREDFMTFIEREKAKAFIPAWHAADFDETAEERWHEVNKLTAEARRLRQTDRFAGARALEMLMWLDTHPHKHRLVERDMQNTSASISLFFPGTVIAGTPFKEWMLSLPSKTQLIDNGLKARSLPYQRTICSNLPSDFLEQAREDAKAKSEGKLVEWDLKLRTMIAKLYKTGIIEPGHIADPAGQAILGTEPGKEENMYIDYLFVDKNFFTPRSDIRDYRTVDLLKIAQQWSQNHPDARFALLRLWTHSHFYPLTMSPDKRDPMSFSDSRSRSWHFRFIPKDVWWSEWSIQNIVEERLRPWKRTLGQRYDVRRDIVLVKGENEKDLQRYTTAVTFGLQTMPWRFEVDFWKSFVNIDIAFLQTLDKAWLE